MPVNKIKKLAQEILNLQSRSIEHINKFIDDKFVQTVQIISQAKGRIIVTGIGKSALISQKIVSTFNSTGTPSIFMHASDAIHGDLGIIQPEDIVIILSKSGETPEIKALIPFIKQRNIILIAITGNIKSYLAQQSNYILNTWVEKEACTHNLAPTTSTTVQLVMGDVLAVCLQELKGFKKEDFAKHHPGGNLGKQLFMQVGYLLRSKDTPKVHPQDDVKKIITEISSKRLGATAVFSDKLEGIITDGDLRRHLEHSDLFLSLKAFELMSPKPITVGVDTLATKALALMQNKQITQLIVLDKDKYIGMIHLHDLLYEGIF